MQFKTQPQSLKDPTDHYPRIERDDTEEEKSNEEEENHEAKMIQQEDENLKKLKYVEI